MHEKVAEYLENRSHQKQLTEEKYRWLVLEYAGLLKDSKEHVEITKDDYERYLKSQVETPLIKGGKYYVLKKPPIEMTDEEFAAVEKEIPEKDLNRIKQDAFGIKKERNWPFILLTAAACLLWTGGLVLALIQSIVPNNWYIDDVMQYSFSFSAFLSALLAYVLPGAVCLFLADVCKKTRIFLKLYKEK